MGDEGVTDGGAVRATWASVGPQAPDAADLTRFALAHSLRDVFLVVPWDGGDAGASRAAALLRGEGMAVAAVGTDPRWAVDPRPLMQWIRRVSLGDGEVAGPTPPSTARVPNRTGGGFSGVHLDVEPWRLPLWDRDRLRTTRGLVELVRHARRLVPDLPLSADLPHWLAAEPYWPDEEAVAQMGPELPTTTGGPRSAPAGPVPEGSPRERPTQVDPEASPGWRPLSDEPGLPTLLSRGPHRVAGVRRSRRSVFESMVDHLDSVTIMVPRVRAHGQGGILDVSAKARAICQQHEVPYLIGLETRPTTDPRRPRASFHDQGAAALARESDRLREALGTDPLFLGVAVHDWQAWSALG